MKRGNLSTCNILASALCAGIFALASRGDGNSTGRFSHRVHPCAPASSRGADRARANTGMTAWYDGRTLRFEHWLDTYCNAEGNLSVGISLTGRVITMHEVYSGEAVRCRCVFKVSGEVRTSGPGTYRIRAVFDNRWVKTRSVIEETEIIVP